MRKTKAQPPRELQWHWHNSRYINKYSSISKSLLEMTKTYFLSHTTSTCLNRAFLCIPPAPGMICVTLLHLLPRVCTESSRTWQSWAPCPGEGLRGCHRAGFVLVCAWQRDLGIWQKNLCARSLHFFYCTYCCPNSHIKYYRLALCLCLKKNCMLKTL